MALLVEIVFHEKEYAERGRQRWWATQETKKGKDLGDNSTKANPWEPNPGG